MDSIGKTTIKTEKKEKFSEEIEALRHTRRSKKKSLKTIDNPEERKIVVKECIKLQGDIKDGIKEEKRIKIEKRLEEVKNPNVFWMER